MDTTRFRLIYLPQAGKFTLIDNTNDMPVITWYFPDVFEEPDENLFEVSAILAASIEDSEEMLNLFTMWADRLGGDA